nr:YqjK family protein [uncultured Rhodoferax sp.]
MSVEEVRLRQQRLLIRSTELRYQLHQRLQGLQKPAARADQFHAAWIWLKQHPQWSAAVLGVMLVLKPRRFLSWTAKLWWLWKTARQVQRWRQTLVSYLVKY